MTITVTNQKGGSGKTTTAVSVAACLVERGRRVLLVDLDPQANATEWLTGGEGSGWGFVRVLSELEPITPLITATNVPGLDIVPGSKRTAVAETRLAVESIPGHAPTERLREALAAVSGYDAILIDTPPTLGYLALNGLIAADTLVVPVECHVMTLQAVPRLLETIATHGLHADVRIVPVRRDRRNSHSGQVVQRLRELHGERVTATEIRENVRIAEAWGWRQPITAYDAKSSGAADYRALTTELFTIHENI